MFKSIISGNDLENVIQIIKLSFVWEVIQYNNGVFKSILKITPQQFSLIFN
jgi:hypothetical protein